MLIAHPAKLLLHLEGYFQVLLGLPERISDGSGADICRYDFLSNYNPPRAMEEKIEGTIKLNITNLSTLKSKMSTSFHMIGNLPWRLAAKIEKTKRTSDVKFFSVYIDCNPESESTLWYCDAIVEFRLLSHKTDEGQVHFCRQFTNKFNFNSNNWGFPSFMEWGDITSNEKGYVKNDKVSVEARITVQKVVGVRNSPTFDFIAFPPNVADTMLVIDGKKLHVSKTYLALYSPVFYAMFFSNFKEREKKEIIVEDVVFEEFVELLNVVYPSHKPVTGENVEFLLELGDKFEIQYVIDECEKFLMTSEEIATITKSVWADQYYLAKLQMSDRVETASRDLITAFVTLQPLKKLYEDGKSTSAHRNSQIKSLACHIQSLLSDKSFKKTLNSTGNVIFNGRTQFYGFVTRDEVWKIGEKKASELYEKCFVTLEHAAEAKDYKSLLKEVVDGIDFWINLFDQSNSSTSTVVGYLRSLKSEMERRFSKDPEPLSEEFWICVEGQLGTSG